MTSSFGAVRRLDVCEPRVFTNDFRAHTREGRQRIKLNSGNTYRIKMDGSHIEQFAWGRVNPFGLMFDPLGNLYSADCADVPDLSDFCAAVIIRASASRNDGLVSRRR